MAGDGVVWGDGFELGCGCAAEGQGFRAAGGKGAALDGGEGRGGFAEDGEGDSLPLFDGVMEGDGGEEELGVGVERGCK